MEVRSKYESPLVLEKIEIVERWLMTRRNRMASTHSNVGAFLVVTHPFYYQFYY